MKKNDFATNTSERPAPLFSRRFNVLLTLTTFLTGIMTVFGISFTVGGLLRTETFLPEEGGQSVFLWNVLFFVCMFCFFLCCLEIRKHKKPFSKSVSFCMQFLGILYTVASGVFPVLTGNDSGFIFLGFFDGTVLTVGLLFFLFGCLLREAFQMQNEIDEIL